MAEEVKTDVGSAEEREQAAERRQREIQEAAVVEGRRLGEGRRWVRGGHVGHPHVQPDRSVERTWPKRSAPIVEGHRRLNCTYSPEVRDTSRQLDH